MNENYAPNQGLEPGFADNEPGRTGGKKVELWEFTCKTCNGKFVTDIYEPRFCPNCGASLYLK